MICLVYTKDCFAFVAASATKPYHFILVKENEISLVSDVKLAACFLSEKTNTKLYASAKSKLPTVSKITIFWCNIFLTDLYQNNRKHPFPYLF